MKWTFNRIFIIGWVLYFALGTGYDSLRHYQRYNALRPDMIVTYSIMNGLMGFIWPLGILSRINDAVYERRNPPMQSSLREEAKQAFSRIEDRFLKVVEPPPDQSGTVAQWGNRREKGTKSQGVVDELEWFMTAYIDNAAELGNDYRRELDAIGMNSTFLNPTRLQNDKTLLESRAILSKAKEVVQRYRVEHFSLLESPRLQIDDLNIDSDLKQEMLQGFDEGVKIAQPKMDRLWNFEEKCVDEFGNILDFLDAKSGSWRAVNGIMSFQSEQDTQKYNAFLANIRYLTMEQEQIKKNAVDATKASFARIREGL